MVTRRGRRAGAILALRLFPPNPTSGHRSPTCPAHPSRAPCVHRWLHRRPPWQSPRAAPAHLGAAVTRSAAPQRAPPKVQLALRSQFGSKLHARGAGSILATTGWR
eukprot:5499384-Pyramimonas_sp.AAC.1